MIEKRFDIPFVADLALREKQIQQNYRPVIAVHKWFARRPGTLFRALLLSEFADGDLRDAFYRSNDLRGITICDPFMGGGTPLLEANRAGCDVVGTDINPMAFWIVREEMRHIDLPAYSEAATKLRSWLAGRVGHLYQTTCVECGARDAPVKYFLWIKTIACDACGSPVNLFPGYLLAENRRHPRNVFLCAGCGTLVETDDRKAPGACHACGFELATAEPARRGARRCSACGARCTFPQARRGAPTHRMVAIEYVCVGCRASRAGRFFKTPDADDLARYAEAERALAATEQVYVPDDAIPAGDETDRLHRWGYRQYREMFNARQLLGLELSCQGLMKHRDAQIRSALATNLSDLLRYQNMLCRYDTMALKSLDVFSVHGFPVGLMQCESNLLGVADPKTRAAIGSGGWLNITGKYARAKAYCDRPFEVAHQGSRKVLVPLADEFIGETRNGDGAGRMRRVDLRCGPAADMEIAPNTLDAVLTDPPYLANVQYAELMDFCYVWLRRLMGESSQELSG